MAISPAIKRAREPAAASSTSYVEIGFLDGNVRTGRLEHFTPTMLDLPVDFDRFGRASLAAEQVAYIASRQDGTERAQPARAARRHPPSLRPHPLRRPHRLRQDHDPPQHRRRGVAHGPPRPLDAAHEQAPETITRLLDMGLDPFSFGDSLLAIVAQRLARTLCSKCRASERGNAEDFAELARAYDEATLASTFEVTYGPDFRVWRAKGCEACSNTGYKGRIGLHEVLVMNDEIRGLVARKGPVAGIRKAACANGMTTLLQDGVAKAIAGQTDMKQVLAVCSK